MIDRYINADGYIAVIISVGYGGNGFSTACNIKNLEFNPKIVEKLLRNEQIYYEFLRDLYPNEPDIDYVDICGLQIIWMKPGTKYKIVSNQGNEFIIYEADLNVIKPFNKL